MKSFTVVVFSAAIAAILATSYGDAVDKIVLEKLANFSCGLTWICQPGGNFDGKLFPCSCDAFCDIARDCCQGYQNNDFSLFRSLNIPPQRFQCLESPLADANFDIMMVHKCPAGWKEEKVRMLCEDSPVVGDDIFQTIHVSGVYSGMVFKNQYCAKCNGEAHKFWNIAVGCNKTFVSPEDPNKKVGIPELLRNKSDCLIQKVTPPKGFEYRKCPKIKAIVETCPQSFKSSVIRELCEKPQGIRPVYQTGNMIMKNVYCGYCNTLSIDELKCPLEIITVRVSVVIYPFSVLFDFNNLDQHEQDVVVCEDDQVFDPFNEKCRDAICSGILVYRNGECVLPPNGGFGRQHLGNEFDCPQIILDKWEYTISDDGVLTVVNSQYAYPPGEYELLENESLAVVCTNFTRNSTNLEVQYSFDEVQGIMTLIGISLSIIGCLMTISVYFSFKSLRNIPGKIVISLCFALVLGYLSLLIGPAMEMSSSACKAFAIIMHFTFLLAFCFMNVMAIDVWYTFSKAYYQAGAQGHKTNRFKFYMAYAFVVAATPVILAIIINETEVSDEFSPHYGEGVCWITKRNALLVFFGMPSLLLITSNVVLFIIAARTIYVAQKNSARLLGKEDKSMLGIYVRLTCVMGLTYLFGYLAPVIQNAAIWYIFIILNTLQGVFIFISFVCTHKVIGLARERASSWSHSRSDNSFSGSRSTTKSSTLTFQTSK